MSNPAQPLIPLARPGTNRKPGTKPAPRGPGARPFTADPRLVMLVQRATQGFSIDEYERAAALGYDAYLEQQLAAPGLGDAQLELRLRPLTTLRMSRQELFDNYGGLRPETTPAIEFMSAHVLRAVYSKHQLLERMVEFWSQHFSIDVLAGQGVFFKPADDRDVIRPNALGKFPDLLRASSRSAAMAFYLDNYVNTKVKPQENYARELLELHTLGVNGGYTETDVKEVARCLTGWGYEGPASGNYGTFKFNPAQHDDGGKLVLGHSIPPGGGESDGLQVLDILANHPKTAEFIARKLIHWLLTETPAQSLVHNVTQVYLQTGGDIREMVRAILGPAGNGSVEYSPQPRFRRPAHLATSLLRGLFIDVDSALVLLAELFALGNMPFTWPTPDGFPDTIDAWGSNVLPRWAFVTRVLAGEIPGLAIEPGQILARLAQTGLALAEAMNAVFAGGTLSPGELESIRKHLAFGAHPSWSRVREAIALLYSAPSLQSY